MQLRSGKMGCGRHCRLYVLFVRGFLPEWDCSCGVAPATTAFPSVCATRVDQRNSPLGHIYALCALKQPLSFTSTRNYQLRMERWFRPSSSLSLRCHLHSTHHSDLQPTELADGCSVQIRGTGAIGNPTKLARGVERWQLRSIGHDV